MFVFYGIQFEFDFMEGGMFYDVVCYDDLVFILEVIRKIYICGFDFISGNFEFMEFEYEILVVIQCGGVCVFFVRVCDVFDSVESDYDVVVIDCFL